MTNNTFSFLHLRCHKVRYLLKVKTIKLQKKISSDKNYKKLFMYGRRILCTLYGAVDFYIVLKRRDVWVEWGRGVQVRKICNDTL